MEINQPITDVEYVLIETDSIVSKTDINGKITYANEDFIRISGYSKGELLGAAHNIIRHPDMPVELFEDLWRTLQTGLPWSGLLKNRCKNGDFYWVETNIAPIFENNQLMGYLSVRRKPEQQQVRDVAAIYRTFIEGNPGNQQIQHGKIVKKSLLHRLPSFEEMSIKCRLWIIIAIMLVMPLIIEGIGLFGMNKDNASIRLVQQHHLMTLNQISHMQKLVLMSGMQISTSLLSPSPALIKTTVTELEQNIATISQIMDEYMKTELNSREKAMATKFQSDKDRLVSDGLQPLISALNGNDTAAIHPLIQNELVPRYDLFNEDAKALIQLQIDDTNQEVQFTQSRYHDSRTLTSAIFILGVYLTLVVCISLQRSIVRPLNATIKHFGQIAQGNYTAQINFKHMHEVGKVMAALKTMQIKLGFDIAEAKYISDENQRIKVALDNVSTGVMIADNDRNIIYANQSVIKILRNTEAAVREQVPSFSVDRLPGTNIDQVHLNPSHQAQLLSSLERTFVASINLGGRSLVVTVNPVINERGIRLGSVAEWLDRTAEVEVEKEVANILVGAVVGDFTKRIAVQQKFGFFRELSEAINQLMQTTESAINEASYVFSVLSHGDLSVKITNHYSGTLGELKEDANSMVNDLNSIIGQIKAIAESIHTAVKEISTGNMALSDRTDEQATRLEQTAASMQQLISIVQQNSSNANQASELAVYASDMASKGVIAIGQVVTMMEGINESSLKIVEIISVIDSIAFQTNILALNAAVEAARAGEQGRGFAVVAGEVRNLAQRVASAAGEIKVLIGESVEKVEDGGKLVTNTGTTIKDIAQSIHGVTAIMSEISAASVEQTASIELVNIAIDQMEDVTQKNAHLVKQATSATESLEEQTQQLTITVAHFKMSDLSNTE